MKILHVIKTSDGARWALEQVDYLVKKGHEVVVILPSKKGKMISYWEKLDITIEYQNCELPIKKPWLYFSLLKKMKAIIRKHKPDIIHSHFFSPTIMLRKVTRETQIPVYFQVAGPLHLENKFFKWWDIKSASPKDRWIASSLNILEYYNKSGIDNKRVGLSYYGNQMKSYQIDGVNLREKLGFDKDDFIIGNLSYFYAPKAYLGQKIGVKGHENAIRIINKTKQVLGLFFGEQFGKKQKYFNIIKNKFSSSKVFFPGALKPFDVSKGWQSLDLCIHTPVSENCGGVLEPLLHEVPVIAYRVGAVEEVIHNGKTGILVEPGDDNIFVEQINYAKLNYSKQKKMALNGQKLIFQMFDVERTAEEIHEYYLNYDDFSNVEKFSSKDYVNEHF